VVSLRLTTTAPVLWGTWEDFKEQGPFSKWYHQYKQKMQPGQNSTKEELKSLNELWKKLGNPERFHKGQLDKP
jgi:hypothetical protein